MIEKVIYIAIIIICTIRVVSYGIYTAKGKNITGAVGLFVMALMVASSSIYFFVN